MNTLETIIHSIREQLETLESHELLIGSSYNIASDKRLKDLNNINEILKQTIKRTNLEIIDLEYEVSGLKNDIQRIYDLQGVCSIDTTIQILSMTLIKQRRTLLAQRNRQLKIFIDNLKTFFKQRRDNYILQSKLDNIPLNDFNKLNSYIKDNYMELHNMNIPNKDIQNLTLEIVAPSLTELSIQTPIKQIPTLPPFVSPSIKIYKTPHNSIMKIKKNPSPIRLTKINTHPHQEMESPFLFCKSIMNPQTPLQNLLSPINIANNRRIAGRDKFEQDSLQLDSPIISITPTKSTFNSISKRRLNCKTNNGLLHIS